MFLQAKASAALDDGSAGPCTICAGAVVALTQIKSLKTEIVSLQRELLPLRERLARFDRAEKAKEAEIKAAAEKAKALAQNLSQQAPLTFSREEVQLIREYIKPAPFAAKQHPLLVSAIPSPGARFPSPRRLPRKCPNCSVPDLPFAMAQLSLSGKTAARLMLFWRQTSSTSTLVRLGRRKRTDFPKENWVRSAKIRPPHFFRLSEINSQIARSRHAIARASYL
jgi:hypothetical protein